MRREVFKRFSLISLAATVLYSGFFVPYAADASETDVPEELQAAIFLKALSYDIIVTGGSNKVVNIGVIVNPKSNKSVTNKDNFVESVNSLKQGITFFSKDTFLSTKPVRAIPININSLVGLKKNEIAILYLTEDLSSLASISKYARDNKVLTLSSDSAHVRNGYASISVMTRNNRPKLLINLKTSRLEGHELGDKVLKFSEVID